VQALIELQTMRHQHTGGGGRASEAAAQRRAAATHAELADMRFESLRSLHTRNLFDAPAWRRLWLRSRACVEGALPQLCSHLVRGRLLLPGVLLRRRARNPPATDSGFPRTAPQSPRAR
jgi:hypothetical protein